MAAWRYEISLLVLKKYFTSERSEQVKYFSTLEEKFRIVISSISSPSCGGEINNWKTRINSWNDEIPHRLYSN